AQLHLAQGWSDPEIFRDARPAGIPVDAFRSARRADEFRGRHVVARLGAQGAGAHGQPGARARCAGHARPAHAGARTLRCVAVHGTATLGVLRVHAVEAQAARQILLSARGRDQMKSVSGRVLVASMELACTPAWSQAQAPAPGDAARAQVLEIFNRIGGLKASLAESYAVN